MVVQHGLTNEILFIAGKDPLKRTGGHASYVRAHAHAALQLGFEPHLFFIGSGNRTTECELGVMHEVESPVTRSILLPIHTPRLGARVAAHLEKRRGPFLLHTIGFWYGVGHELRRRGEMRGVNITSSYSTLRHEYRARLDGALGGVSLRLKVDQVLEYAVSRHVRARYEGNHLCGSDLVLVNYQSVSDIIDSEYGSDVRCRKIPYCADSAFLRDSVVSPRPETLDRFTSTDAPLIVAVSRHDPRKGLDHLLLALAQLKESGIRFRACLVGGGTLLAAHRRFASKLGLDGWVAVEGIVEDPFAYLRYADVFVLPSTEEGSGSISLLEALQAGVPVVATRIDGMPEDVGEMEAVLVEPRNPEAIARALRNLISDKPLRTRMAAAARARYETAFSAEAFTTALGKVYHEFGFTQNNDQLCS